MFLKEHDFLRKKNLFNKLSPLSGFQLKMKNLWRKNIETLEQKSTLKNFKSEKSCGSQVRSLKRGKMIVFWFYERFPFFQFSIEIISNVCLGNVEDFLFCFSSFSFSRFYLKNTWQHNCIRESPQMIKGNLKRKNVGRQRNQNNKSKFHGFVRHTS